MHELIICEDHFWFEVALLGLRCPQVLLLNRHLRVCVRLNSHSCRFLCDVDLQVDREQRFLRFPRMWEFPFGRTHLLFAAPMVGAPPDNIGAKRLAQGGVPAIGADSAKGQGSDGATPKVSAKELESDPN
jgi:hypothetical protein